MWKNPVQVALQGLLPLRYKLSFHIAKDFLGWQAKLHTTHFQPIMQGYKVTVSSVDL